MSHIDPQSEIISSIFIDGNAAPTGHGTKGVLNIQTEQYESWVGCWGLDLVLFQVFLRSVSAFVSGSGRSKQMISKVFRGWEEARRVHGKKSKPKQWIRTSEAATILLAKELSGNLQGKCVWINVCFCQYADSTISDTHWKLGTQIKPRNKGNFLRIKLAETHKLW